MLEHLINFVSHLGPWGYLVIFIIVALECQALLGLFMPGESLVLVGGFLAEQGVLNLHVLILVVSVAAIFGDSIGYQLGRYLGRKWLVQHAGRFGLRPDNLARVDDFLAKHGGKAVFSSHFMHLLRSLMPFVAGERCMPYPRFLIFNAMGCMVWATVFVSIGYWAGKSWQVAEKWVGTAGKVVAGALLLALAAFWLWRWLVRHKDAVQRRGLVLAEHRYIVAFRQRFSLQIQFFFDRLSPRGPMGLPLTLGVLLIISASSIFGCIAEDVVTGDPLTIVDMHIAGWFNMQRTPRLTTAMQCVTILGSIEWVTVFGAVTALVLCWKHLWYRLLAVVLVLPCGMLVNSLLKIVFQRHRPSFDGPLMVFPGYSFPSGHTMAATLLYGLLAVFAVIALNTWRWRIAAVLGAIVVILLVGFSRVCLGAHYLSDVLGAVTAGLAWLALSLTAVDTLRRSRNSQP